MKFTLFSRAIQAEVTGIDQHQQNGAAERAHKTIYDRVGPTLAHAKLPPKFWPEIARTAAYLSNRSPSSKLQMTPYQAWYGEKPDLSRLRVIGSKGEYLVPPKQRKKLTEPRTRPCILLGYEGNTNYRILLEDGRIVGTPNAEFQEAPMTPSTQTIQDVGAKRYGLPEATAAAAGGSETVGLLNQPSVSIRPASVPASGRHTCVAAPEQAWSETSDEDSQILPRVGAEDSQRLPRASTKDSQVLPWAGDGDSQILPRASNDDSQTLSRPSDDDSQPVAEQGDMTLSPHRSDDAFGSFSETSQGDESLPNGDQQRDNTRHDQASGERQRYTRRSTAGYLFNIGSGAISWQFKRQSVVALSTCEAEFIGQTQATKEAIWLRRLLNELNLCQGKAATIICGDNQGTIALSSNPQYHSRTKHMDIQRKWQGEVQEAGTGN